MVPSARPVLHYVLDRLGTPERTMTVRASNYDWPIKGPTVREIQLQWVAADPAAYDPTTQTATAYAGSQATAGRTYNLTFPRTYPAGGAAPSTGTITSFGDLPAQPAVRIYGPATTPQLNFSWQGATAQWPSPLLFWFKAGTTINAGEWIDIDPANRRVIRNGDLTQPAITAVDWSRSRWPLLPPATTVTMQLVAGAATAITQAVASWNDAYLS